MLILIWAQKNKKKTGNKKYKNKKNVNLNLVTGII